MPIQKNIVEHIFSQKWWFDGDESRGRIRLKEKHINNESKQIGGCNRKIINLSLTNQALHDINGGCFLLDFSTAATISQVPENFDDFKDPHSPALDMITSEHKKTQKNIA